MIELTGITWEVRGNHVCISITEEQKEQWLFHLAFCIGKNSYKKYVLLDEDRPL